jgi:hypothetical protein
MARGMNATHLRNIFMPLEGVEMTGNDPKNLRSYTLTVALSEMTGFL